MCKLFPSFNSHQRRRRRRGRDLREAGKRPKNNPVSSVAVGTIGALEGTCLARPHKRFYPDWTAVYRDK